MSCINIKNTLINLMVIIRIFFFFLLHLYACRSKSQGLVSNEQSVSDNADMSDIRVTSKGNRS